MLFSASQSASKRNARLALTISFLEDLTFILPIWLLFGVLDLGYSTTVTTSLFMLIWLTSGLLEIPTGALADRFGRKRIFLIGMGLLSLYPLAYAFRLPLAVIAVVSLLSAVGSALRSGTLVPMTHESYKRDNRTEKDYHAFLSNHRAMGYVARAISGIAGGLLFAVDHRAPYFAMFLVYVVAFLAGLLVRDVYVKSSDLSNRTHISSTLKAMKSHGLIVSLLLIFVAAELVGEALWTALQPLFNSDGLRVEVIGLLFSVTAVVSAIGAHSTRYLMRRIGVLRIELIVSVLILIAVILNYTHNITAHILAVLPLALAFGLTVVPIHATAQKLIHNTYHSTALSVISVAQYVVYGVASLYVSVLIDVIGVSKTRGILLVAAAVSLIYVVFRYVTRKGEDMLITSNELVN